LLYLEERTEVSILKKAFPRYLLGLTTVASITL